MIRPLSGHDCECRRYACTPTTPNRSKWVVCPTCKKWRPPKHTTTEIDNKPQPQQKVTTMKISDLFPSSYLKASDLAGRDPVTLTIKGVKVERVGDDDRPILYFIGSEKGLCLNKTNASTIVAGLQTDDTDKWPGAQLQLYATETDYQGQRVPCLRVGAVMPSQAPQPPAGTDPLNHAQPF